MIACYRQQLAKSCWQSDPADLNEVQRDWLLHQDSLTKKLQQHFADFAVKVQFEGLTSGEKNAFLFASLTASPPSAEPTFKMLKHFVTACNESTWLREVLLYGNGKPMIFAQTRMPEASFQAFQADLLKLNDTPIGLWLFAQQPERLSLEWQKTDGEHYARRAVYRLAGHLLEIRELFLPDFWLND